MHPGTNIEIILMINKHRTFSMSLEAKDHRE